MAIVSMGKFTAVGMRAKVEDPNALVINTCGQNDTADRGSFESWVWSNPTVSVSGWRSSATTVEGTRSVPVVVKIGTSSFAWTTCMAAETSTGRRSAKEDSESTSGCAVKKFGRGSFPMGSAFFALTATPHTAKQGAALTKKSDSLNEHASEAFRSSKSTTQVPGLLAQP